MKKNEQGSALLWAVCTLLILTLLLAGFMAIATSYYGVESKKLSKTQAEYFARSGIELVSGEMTADFGDEENPYIPIADKDVTVKLDLNGTECIVVCTLVTGQQINLQSTVTINGQTAVISARVITLDNENWQFDGYTTL